MTPSLLWLFQNDRYFFFSRFFDEGSQSFRESRVRESPLIILLNHPPQKKKLCFIHVSTKKTNLLKDIGYFFTFRGFPPLTL